MENDITIQFCDIYFNLINNIVTITLINNEQLIGFIEGYFYEDLNDAKPTIAMWAFVQTTMFNSFAHELKNGQKKIILQQKHISNIEIRNNKNEKQVFKF